jgi:hypothetical protein
MLSTVACYAILCHDGTTEPRCAMCQGLTVFVHGLW